MHLKTKVKLYHYNNLNMQTYSPIQVKQVALELKKGKVVIAPTDTIFGILSLCQEKIYKIKNRSLNKKIIIFINDLFSLKMPKVFEQELIKYLPGKLSFIYKGVGYRIPNNQFIHRLIDLVGPIYCSSANISCQSTIKNLQEAKTIFHHYENDICLIDDENNPKQSKPSTIIDLDKMMVLRHGEIDGEKILIEIKKRINCEKVVN